MVYRLTGDKYSDTMIYNIAFVYNGAIWLDNERGRVILDTISNAKNPTMEAGDGMLHILLCDDDAIFTEALKRLIEAQPEFNRRYMQIECVHDPNALKKAAVQKADMIFLDIDMGDVNGIALARQIRTIRKDAVLIFVTNYGEYAAEGYEVSAFRFLPKLQLAEKLPDYFRQALAACRSRTRTLNVLCDTGSAAEKPHEPAHAGRKTGGGGIFAHPQQLLGQYELYCCPANKRRYVDYRSGASRQPARV